MRRFRPASVRRRQRQPVPPTAAAAPTVVYVPPAFVKDPDWWWAPMAELLGEHELPTCTVGLPSCGDEPPLGDLHADAGAVRDAVLRMDGEVILVGHSYSGAVITEGGVGAPNVRHLVYIAAVVPDRTSIAESGYIPPEAAARIAEDFDIGEDGTLGERLEHVRNGMLAGLPEDTIEQALERRTRQSMAVFGQPVDGVAWGGIPSTYVVCLNDRDIPVEIQRAQAERTGSVVELPTNHFPYIEEPQLVADLLVGIADGLRAGSGALAGSRR